MLLDTSKLATQMQPLPGSSQIENSTGDSWQLDDWGRVDRFLVLGCEGGTYHAQECELVLQNAAAAQRCIAADGLRLINRIVAISESGRAPKNDPAIFLLAMTAKLGDEPTRRAAYAALPKVCRIGTHLMHFAHYAQGFGGWGRGMRKAVGSWFNARPASELAYQLARYQARDGWSNRDLLRLAHPRAASPSHDRLFAWAVNGQLPDDAADDSALALIVAMRELATLRDPEAAADVIRAHRVPRECVPTPLLRSSVVWEALLEAMPLTEMIRNLATMTRVGLIAVGAEATAKVARELRNADRIAKARVHPLSFLAALVTYQSGRGRGESWIPVVDIVDALDAAFYTSFGSVEPANKRMLLALDVSGSMGSGSIAGVTGLTPRIGSAAMALITAATEANHQIVGFTAASGGGFGGKWGPGGTGITPLDISPRKRLENVVSEIGAMPFGGTDCALPMIWAKDNKVDVDTFVVYTDGETWAGDVHPVQALRTYRDARGIPAKLVVVGMTSNGFSIADPDDAGMLDVVGFDTSTPPVLSDFARA